MAVILHQFEFSHFNEKARWALAFKGVAHERQSYLPGPHMAAIRRLSGQTKTPVLQIDDTIVAGSANIIDALETRYPEPPLYPANDALRRDAQDLQFRFDSEIGPAVRTALFSVMIEHGSYMTAMFARGKPVLKRLAYRATFPLAKPLIARGNGVDDPANVLKSFDVTARALDEVASRILATGYLAGDAFSVADLAAAALLAPIAGVRHADMARPQPVPPAVARFVERYASHDAIAWVNRMYDQHRP